jgi:N-acetylglutamate synthase-like GNAT family acetyltransferase
MNIREATEHDIPAIVGLLKQSLGEELMPKSEQYWRWKHVENPFGASPVLLAFDGELLVGIRAFMRWRWKIKDDIKNAVRAVDTATHPDFQGKGIFKKLTLGLLEECKKKGWDFVFNTPNTSSKPGYLKMGWEEAGKLPIHMQFVQPVSMAFHYFQNAKNDIAQGDGSVSFYVNHGSLPEFLKGYQETQSNLISNHTVDSLRWRYLDVPVAKYFAGGIEEDSQLKALFFYRLKSSRFGNELRVTDLFVESDQHLSTLKKVIQQKIKQHNVQYLTVSGTNRLFQGTGLLTLKKLSIGPSVTIRSIQDNSLTILRNFSGWDPSLGDLELF